MSELGHFNELTIKKWKKLDRPYGAQGNVWNRYGDSSSATSAEESGRRGSQGRRETQEREWPPWPSSQTAGRPARPTPSRTYEMKPANRGENPWTSWTKQVRASVPDSQDEARSSYGRPSQKALLPPSRHGAQERLRLEQTFHLSCPNFSEPDWTGPCY